VERTRRNYSTDQQLDHRKSREVRSAETDGGIVEEIDAVASHASAVGQCANALGCAALGRSEQAFARATREFLAGARVTNQTRAAKLVDATPLYSLYSNTRLLETGFLMRFRAGKGAYQ
jgi:hypothetical protein